MDFELNWFFPSQKCSVILKSFTFVLIFSLYTKCRNGTRHIFLSLRPTPYKWKKSFWVYNVFLGILNIFLKKMLRGWELGWLKMSSLPPCLDFFPSLTIFFCEGFPNSNYIDLTLILVSDHSLTSTYLRGQIFKIAITQIILSEEPNFFNEGTFR